MNFEQTTQLIRLAIGAFGGVGFGAVIGWYVYLVTRYRTGSFDLQTVSALIGIVGGATITGLFGESSTVTFGGYGIGLALGFFSYYRELRSLVDKSENFNEDWFLDGRRKLPDPKKGEAIPETIRETVTAMSFEAQGQPSTPNQPGEEGNQLGDVE